MFKARELRKMIDSAKRNPKVSDPEQFIKGEITYLLTEGGAKPEDFSLQDLFVNLIDGGQELCNDWARASKRGQQVTEGAGAVDTADFSRITGQIVFSAVQDSYKLETGISDRLVTNFPSVFLGTELVPGIAATADQYADPIPEGFPYPLVGMSATDIRLPAAEKRGGIIPITREAVIADRTGKVLQEAGTVGQGMGINKEKRILDVFIGAVNPYEFKGETRNTYSNAAMGFDNLSTEILTDFTDIRILTELFYAMSDPSINEPLDVAPTTIVCGNELAWQVRSVIRNVQVRQGDITGAPFIQGINDGNRIPFDLDIIHNEFLIRQLILGHNADGVLASNTRALANAHWWFGNPKAAFVYKEIWSLTTEEAPMNNEEQFRSDIWHRVKVSEMGVPGVREPRAIIRSGGTVAT
jgi:hypothetical protein